MAKKRKKRGKKAPFGTTVAFLGAVMSQAIGQILGDAAEVFAERVADLQKNASKKIKKAQKHADSGVNGIANVSAVTS